MEEEDPYAKAGLNTTRDLRRCILPLVPGIVSAVAYTPIELRLYDTFARAARAHELTVDIDTTQDGLDMEVMDPDWVPPGGEEGVKRSICGPPLDRGEIGARAASLA